MDETERLRKDNNALRAENEQLRRENEQLRAANADYLAALLPRLIAPSGLLTRFQTFFHLGIA